MCSNLPPEKTNNLRISRICHQKIRPTVSRLPACHHYAQRKRQSPRQAKGKDTVDSAARNVNPHSSKPMVRGQMTISIIAQLPPNANRRQATENALKTCIAMLDRARDCQLPLEFSTPARATEHLLAMLPEWRDCLSGYKGGGSGTAVKVIFSDGKYILMTSLSQVGDAIGDMSPDTISAWLRGSGKRVPN